MKGFAERAALGISGEGACVVAEPACTLPCHPLRVRCHVTPYALILCLVRSTCPDLQIARCLLNSWLRILSDTQFTVDRPYRYPHTALERGETTLLTQTSRWLLHCYGLETLSRLHSEHASPVLFSRRLLCRYCCHHLSQVVLFRLLFLGAKISIFTDFYADAHVLPPLALQKPLHLRAAHSL